MVLDLQTLELGLQGVTAATLLGIFYRLGHLGERVRAVEHRVAKLERIAS